MTTSAASVGSVRVALLGPIRLERGGVDLPLGGTKQRTFLAVLALNAGRVVLADSLITAMWGDAAPTKALANLQVYASVLRRLMQAPTPGNEGESPLQWQQSGYRLNIAPDAVDVGRFHALTDIAARERSAGDLAQAAAHLRQALDLWRGPALAELAAEPFAIAMIARLDAERMGAVEQRLEIEMDLGLHQQLLPELQDLVHDHPLRERLWELWILAQYRTGRQGEALASFRQARQLLADELGIDPGSGLRHLEQMVLAQDSSIELAPIAAPGAGKTTTWDDSQPATAWLLTSRGEHIALGNEPIVIGRLAEADIALHDSRVSRRHAAIHRTDAGHQVTDLASTNGTSLNGVRLTPQHPYWLNTGDRIVVGSAAFVFTTELPIDAG